MDARQSTSLEARIGRVARSALARLPRRGWQGWLVEFLAFGLKQAWACLFGAAMLALILLTHLFYPADAELARYDALVIGACLIQAAMLVWRLESWAEARVILAFHLVGTAMEVFKTAAGSWSYPEPNLLRIGGVPLFSGFMYAAVGSYLARAWRLFEFRFTRYPPRPATLALALAIYVNFFAHHYGPDLRLGLFALVGLLWWGCRVHYRPLRHRLAMPLLVGFGLVALFIWFAENLGTFARAWTYPDQAGGWRLVSPAKLGAWYLLMIISFVLVTLVHRPEPEPPLPTEVSRKDLRPKDLQPKDPRPKDLPPKDPPPKEPVP